MFSRKALIVLVCGATMTTLAMGLRQSHPLFLNPVTADLGIGRDTFGLTMALAHIMFGLAQPIVGSLADRYGPGRTAFLGGLPYVAGMAMAAHATTPLALHATLGVTVGLAMAATTFTVAMTAVGRVVPAHRRGLAFGITTAAGSLGMFVLIPVSQALLLDFGWRDSILIQTAMALALPLLGLALAGTKRPEQAGEAQSLGAALRLAAGHRGYQLLAAGYFVCGFHVAFIATHLPAYLSDLSASPATAASALALIGLFNVAGSFLFGWLGDRFRKKTVLSCLYLARSVVIAGFVALPFSEPLALLFGAAVGLLWLGTIPLTSGLIASMFGLRHLGTLAGIVFLSHQIGSFAGAWGGGLAYAATGSYDLFWQLSILLGLFAAAIHLPIPEAHPVRPAPAPAS